MQEEIAQRLRGRDLAEISRVSGVSGAILKQIRDNKNFRPTLGTLIKTAAACGVTE